MIKFAGVQLVDEAVADTTPYLVRCQRLVGLGQLLMSADPFWGQTRYGWRGTAMQEFTGVCSSSQEFTRVRFAQEHDSYWCHRALLGLANWLQEFTVVRRSS